MTASAAAGPGDQTFLFADMAGFTAMTEAHGDEMAAEAAADFGAVVAARLPEFDAEQVKSMGDAVMVRVPEAGRAIDLAVQLITETGARHGALALRVGAHTGPAVHRDGDWFGSTVNLAARLSAAAQRGEILLSRATHDAAGPALGRYRLDHRARQRFKNVARPVDVYALALARQADARDFPMDPVCRMAVEPGRCPETRNHRGRTFHFCAVECAAVFDLDPDRYLTDAPRASR